MSDSETRTKRSKKKFLTTFCVVMVLFAIIRHAFSIHIPQNLSQVQEDKEEVMLKEGEVYVGSNYDPSASDELNPLDTIGLTPEEASWLRHSTMLSYGPNDIYNRPHPINGVWSYDKCFHDLNDVQVIAAQANGIKPVRNRQEAQALIVSHKLVNISQSPYYIVDNLTHSMPYLVPKAQQLLNTICLNFIDSLQMKGIMPHLPVITSVLRTTDDVKNLQKGNGNATTNSCHCYGTTVDISYNRFVPISGKHDPSSPLTRWNEDMKQVLSEVLSDLREKERCYVKYEVKQGCYHLTVR